MSNKLIKKLNTSILASLFIFLGLISCYDSGYEEFVPPTGNVNNIQPSTLFTTSTDAENSLKLIFRSYSTNATSYVWDFGDGNVSNEENPDYTYTTGGLYNVKLTTTSSDGLTAVDSTDVSPIFVDFSLDALDSQVTFTNETTGAKNLTWNFGDGDTAEWESIDTTTDPDFSPVHTYKTADVFDVTLTVINFLDKEYTVTKKVEGLVLAAIPDFSFTTSSLTATFKDESFLSQDHSWNFGDGNTSTELNPVHTYATKGAYNVTLTTKNNAGVSRSVTKGVAVGGVDAKFKAIILNGSIDEFTGNKDDNNDAWELDPPDKLKDGSDSPYAWDNASLETSVSGISKLRSAGITTTENSGTYALKFSANDRRAYQPFTVEVGVEYTMSMFVRTETTDEFKIYILNNEVSDESDLTGNSDKVYTVSGNPNSYVEHTFTFKATTATAVFYAVPFSGISGSSEVYLDDISIKTPGF